MAVFLSYLHSQNRDDDIGSLIKGKDFGQWVRKRIRMTVASLQVQPNDNDLALLVAQFPMKSVDCLLRPDSRYANLFHALKKDGWVEVEKIQDSTDTDEQWAISHDVFADEIVISYLKEYGFSKQFFGTLFRESFINDTLHSALVTTERIACHLNDLTSGDWYKVISESIAEKPDRWKDVRNNLLKMSILELKHSVKILEQNEILWADAEKDFLFQGSLGWMVRQLCDDSEPSQDCILILLGWLKKAAPYATTSNYLINSGLRLFPEGYKDLALNFISSHTDEFQNHFSIVVWLNEGLPLDSIIEFIYKWLDRYPRSFQVSFILKAWINASGDKIQIWPYLESWLNSYSEEESTEHVYYAWLETDGDINQIWPYLKKWLELHGGEKSAQYVYTAWFKTKTDVGQIWCYLESWLNSYSEDEPTEHVYSAWLEADGDINQIWPYLKKWLELHYGEESARYVYSAWLGTDGDINRLFGIICG